MEIIKNIDKRIFVRILVHLFDLNFLEGRGTFLIGCMASMIRKNAKIRKIRTFKLYFTFPKFKPSGPCKEFLIYNGSDLANEFSSENIFVTTSFLTNPSSGDLGISGD